MLTRHNLDQVPIRESKPRKGGQRRSLKKRESHLETSQGTGENENALVWLDVTMYEATRMNILDSLNHLICEHQHGLEAELAMAKVEQVFQTRAEQINCHNIILPLRSKPADLWNTNNRLTTR